MGNGDVYMYKIIALCLMLCASAAFSQQQFASYEINDSHFDVGDRIQQVQQLLGKPDFTFAVENPYGAVVQFDYVWNVDSAEITMVVDFEGTVVDIWMTDSI